MNDNEQLLINLSEMASHSEGTAQFIYNLIGGGIITNDQARETMEYFKAKVKCNIESNPYLSRKEKDNEISIRESWFNALKISMGL